MRKFVREFKEFALKGNVMNLAIGIIIGAAFREIVESLTENILSPLIGLFAGQDFEHLYVRVFGAEIRYGAFITSIINFILMALVIFVIIKFINKALKANLCELSSPEVEPTTKACPFCVVKIDINAQRCPNCTSYLED